MGVFRRVVVVDGGGLWRGRVLPALLAERRRLYGGHFAVDGAGGAGELVVGGQGHCLGYGSSIVAAPVGTIPILAQAIVLYIVAVLALLRTLTQPLGRPVDTRIEIARLLALRQ